MLIDAMTKTGGVSPVPGYFGISGSAKDAETLKINFLAANREVFVMPAYAGIQFSGFRLSPE